MDDELDTTVGKAVLAGLLGLPIAVVGGYLTLGTAVVCDPQICAHPARDLVLYAAVTMVGALLVLWALLVWVTHRE